MQTIAVVLAALTWTGFGADTAQKVFDLPSDAAERTLRSFAAQSGLEVLFLTEVTKNIRTNAVQGALVPKEAIDRMLAGTNLVALENKRTGAFKIQRSSGPNQPGTDPANRDHPESKKKTDHREEPATQMKSRNPKNPFAVLGAWLTLALAAPPAAPGADGVAGDTRQTGAITGRVKNVATGQYLNQARISVRGTTLTVYTDNFGAFRLLNVPPGPAVLEVFYTDLDPAEIPVQVPPGGSIEQAIDLTSIARYGSNAAIKLDPFVVALDRETDAQAIATNEQRFAPNIKNVLATDALGDVLGNSVGEFLKFMPGVAVEYGGPDAISVSVRGISSSMITVASDGVAASNTWHNSSRSVDFRSMSLNDVARIELTKVPTPAMPADSLGGSVNFVSKSAFERSGRQLRFGVSVAGLYPYGDLTLKKTPDAYSDTDKHKVLPNVDFDFTWPVTKTFGIVLTGMHSNIFNEVLQSRQTWTSAGTGANASAASRANPIMTSYYFRGGSRKVERNSLSAKADWRVSQHSVLSLGHTINRTVTEIGAFNFTASTGTNGTPAPATGSAMTWGDSFTQGATGRGSLNLNGGITQHVAQKTDNTNLRYRYDDGRWEIDTRLGRSASVTLLRDNEKGFFQQANIVNRDPVRIDFVGIGDHKPGTIRVVDNTGRVFDWRDLSIYRGNNGTLAAGSLENQFKSANVNVRRRIGALSFPASVQLGGVWQERDYDRRSGNRVWEFRGPDGVSRNTAPIGGYAMQNYRDREFWGFEGVTFPSTKLFYEAYRDNPLLFAQTVAQQYTAVTNLILNSEHIVEKVESAFIQTEASLLEQRLRFVAGVRFEKTTGVGEGALIDPNAVWRRDPSGNFLRDAQGNRIRKPEAGSASSLQEIALTHTERGAVSQRNYQGYYPSAHLTYSVRENLLIRGAYAKTYGRPNFADIIPRTTISQSDLDAEDLADPSIPKGTLNVRNSGLKPWTADNFDLSVEYYAKRGGMISGGIFLKELKDFFGSYARLATEADLATLGLDPAYVGWNLVTKFNAGEARVQGAEINLQHSLEFLGSWGRRFNVFANGTKLELRGSSAADFGSFVPEGANWGLAYAHRRISLNARWNYQGLTRGAPQAAFGPDGYEYDQARTTMDFNAAYQLSSRLSVNLSINNVLNAPRVLLRYGGQTPGHARVYQRDEYGTRVAVGVKGTF